MDVLLTFTDLVKRLAPDFGAYRSDSLWQALVQDKDLIDDLADHVITTRFQPVDHAIIARPLADPHQSLPVPNSPHRAGSRAQR